MKKILFVSTVSSMFDKPLRKAFERLGYRVETVDYRGHWILEIGHPIHRLIGRLPAPLVARARAFAQRRVDRAILAAAERMRPDYVFVSKAKEISYGTLDKLRAMAVTMNYYPETTDHWETIRKLAPHYSYFLNYDRHIVDSLTAQGYPNALYVPFSAEIEPNASWARQSSYPYTVSFIGSFVPVRYQEREDLLSRVKDLGLNIWGNKAWLATSLKDFYRGRPSTEEMYDIYRKSKIVVNIDLLSSFAGTGVNLRPFEITAAGAMLLNHDNRKDIFNLFENGKEFVAFSGPDDLRTAVCHYLEHEDERSAVARAGFERTRDTHSYVARMAAVFAAIEQKKT